MQKERRRAPGQKAAEELRREGAGMAESAEKNAGGRNAYRPITPGSPAATMGRWMESLRGGGAEGGMVKDNREGAEPVRREKNPCPGQFGGLVRRLLTVRIKN